jgi:hypothetical protein
LSIDGKVADQKERHLLGHAAPEFRGSKRVALLDGS